MRLFPNRISMAVAAAALAASSPAWAIYANGGFESGNFSAWTMAGGTNPGLAGAPPFTGASIVINGSAPGPASTVGAISDPRAPTIVLPRVGLHTAKLSDEAGGATITTMTQVDTLTQADVDPADGFPHIRFAFAPVLDDPSHSAHEQPYFYVSVKNLATNAVLFEQFAYSGQPGVSYLNGSGNWKYLEFQDVDAVLPASAIGAQIELRVVAAKCSLGGHGGYVYVDGFGSSAVPPPTGGAAPYASVAVPALPAPALALLAALLATCGLVFRRLQRR